MFIVAVYKANVEIEDVKIEAVLIVIVEKPVE